MCSILRNLRLEQWFSVSIVFANTYNSFTFLLKFLDSITFVAPSLNAIVKSGNIIVLYNIIFTLPF